MLKVDEIINILSFLQVNEPKKILRNRELWIHELVAVCERKEDFSILLPHLEKDPKKFFNYFQMSLNSFNEWLASIQLFHAHSKY